MHRFILCQNDMMFPLMVCPINGNIISLRLMLSKGAKRTIVYHITVILQYCWNKTIARSGDMYRDDLGILSLAIKCFGITNTSWQKCAVWIASVKTVLKCLRKLKVLWTNLINILSTVVLYCWCHSDSASVLLYFTYISSLMTSPLRAVVICQK